MDGMLSSGMAQPQQAGFNGTVMYNGTPVAVRNSVAIVDGEKYIVSDDGSLVVNERGELAGIIQDGTFIEATPEIVDQLRQQGVFGEQPEGMAAQAQG